MPAYLSRTPLRPPTSPTPRETAYLLTPRLIVAQAVMDAMATRAYNSDVAEHALQVDQVVQAISRQKQATYKAEKQVEVEIEKFVDEKKDAYTHTCRSSVSVSGAVGLGVAGALGVAADASAFFLAAVTEAAAAHILPDSVPQAFATWISQVGGADNASLVVAAAAGLSAAVAVKTSLYATRRGPRRRARAELAAAKQQLHEQVSKRRRVEREALDASRAAKRIRQVRNWAEKGGEGGEGEEGEEASEGEDASEGEEASSD